jgi:signal transduction histidine kinase/AraC-like DNA-binding protein
MPNLFSLKSTLGSKLLMFFQKSSTSSLLKIIMLLFILCLANVANAQETQYLTIDSLTALKKEYQFLYSQDVNKSTKEIKDYSTLLDAQKKLRLLRNENTDEIVNLQVQSMFDLISHVYSNKHQLDSVNYYQQKVISLTDDPQLRSQSYGLMAFAYRKEGLIGEAVKGFELAIKTNTSDALSIHPRTNLIRTLIQLNSLEHAKKSIYNLSQKVESQREHLRYTNYLELITILKALLLIKAENHKEALILLKQVDVTKLDKKTLLYLYHNGLHHAHKGLGEYDTGEMFLDKQFDRKGSIEPILNIKGVNYYIEKLKYAVLNKNEQKADIWYKSITDLTAAHKNYDLNTPDYLKALSNYYTLKKNYKSALSYIEKAHDVGNSDLRMQAKERFEIDQYYIQLDEELLKIKKLSKAKDLEINKYINIFINLSILLTFIFVIILYFRQRKEDKYRLEIQTVKTITEAKQAFIENMSHEIRNPITSIMGYLMLLKENSLDPIKTMRYTDIAFKNSENMISSLNGFLTLLKSEKEGILPNKKTSKKFNFFVNKIMSSYSADVALKNINLYYKTNIRDTLIIKYNFDNLSTIITNVISNAIKYSNANSSIYVTINLTETNLHITVKDYGIGIAEEDKDNIFSRFYQSKNNTATGGYGIGLSLAFQLIKSLNGRIRLESEIDLGSVFYIDLPLKVELYSLNTTNNMLEFQKLSIDSGTKIVPQEVSNFPKALIVDDNIEMIRYLKELFMSYLDCTFAYNGQEALLRAKEESYDIIISDFRMPVLNGLKFKEELHKINNYKDIPFIIITAVFYDQFKGFKNTLGFNEYIEKPFSKNEILSRVQFALERSLSKNKIRNLNIDAVKFEGYQPELMEKIKGIVLDNLTNPDFKIETIAKICGYSQKNLNIIVKSMVGLNLVNIVLEIRLLKSYEFIVKHTHPTLNEVMYNVGLNSRAYFNKRFEERFGIKASDLKKKTGPSPSA